MASYDALLNNAEQIELSGSYMPSKEVRKRFGFHKERIIIFTDKDADYFEIWTHRSFMRNHPYSNVENWHDQSVLMDNLDHVEFGFSQRRK